MDKLFIAKIITIMKIKHSLKFIQ